MREAADTLLIFAGERRRIFVDVLREVIDKESGESSFDPAAIEELKYACIHNGECYAQGPIIQEEEYYFIWFEPSEAGSYRFTFSFMYSGETFQLKMVLIVREGQKLPV